MSNFEQPVSLAIERLIALVTSDESLEQSIKDAFIKDVKSIEPGSLSALREILLSDENGATNGNADEN